MQAALRIGLGFDAHPLTEGRRLVLGGVEVPYPRGLDGHSDADVLSHAIADALLGAAALGDLGQHFPSSDPAYRGVSSMALLAQVAALLAQRDLQIVAIDSTVVAEAPRLAPFFQEMRLRLGAALGIEVERVSVKATTTDGLGFVGRGEGIAALAVALLEERGKPGSGKDENPV